MAIIITIPSNVSITLNSASTLNGGEPVVINPATGEILNTIPIVATFSEATIDATDAELLLTDGDVSHEGRIGINSAPNTPFTGCEEGNTRIQVPANKEIEFWSALNLIAKFSFDGGVSDLNCSIRPNVNEFYFLGSDNRLWAGIYLSRTITPGGTTGAQTINKSTGSVNFAIGATSLVVTSSYVAANSIIIATVATNDATMKSVQVVAASGSFTIYANAAATAETRVNFLIILPNS